MRWALGTSLRFARLVVALAIGVMVFGNDPTAVGAG